MGTLANIGESLSSKSGKAVLFGGLFAAGAIKKSYRGAVELGNQTAFGNDDADKFFMGEQGISPSGLLDATTGSKAAGIGSIAGAVGGGGLGLALGHYASKGSNEMLKGFKLANDVKIPETIGKFKIPGIGGKTLLKEGVEGSMHGLGALGAVAGAAIGATALLHGNLKRNKQFFAESAYSRGSAMQARSAQAYGDVVFGMYNSRRG
jgi:hypothetical protein